MSASDWPVIEIFPDHTRLSVQLGLESFDGSSWHTLRYHTSDLVAGEVLGGFADRHPGAPGVLIVRYVVRALQDLTLSTTQRPANLEAGRAYVIRQQQKELELDFRKVAKSSEEYPICCVVGWSLSI